MVRNVDIHGTHLQNRVTFSVESKRNCLGVLSQALDCTSFFGNRLRVKSHKLCTVFAQVMQDICAAFARNLHNLCKKCRISVVALRTQAMKNHCILIAHILSYYERYDHR